MSRPSFEDIYMRLAEMMAERSTCRRLQVGCVIVSPDFRRVYAVGYNGGASGLDNDCESDQPGQCGHIHAEQNAVINCTVDRDKPKMVFCTDMPCATCAKFLVNLGGVVEVRYRRTYRLHAGVDLLGSAHIVVAQQP